jgi:LuxR family maltose regulon positive regulatory protein
LIISLLAAIAKLKTDDVSGAMEDFKRAYSLSFDGVFEMPFIELGKELHPLVVAASKQADSGIPDEWLKKIDRKASIYAKKAAVIRNSYKRDKNIDDIVQLSNREKEILTDLYHGLIREEIAENRHLSLPTVKKILESIYIKLDANNVADAHRIAIKNKLIIE